MQEALFDLRRDVRRCKCRAQRRKRLQFYDDPENLTSFFGESVDNAVDEYLDADASESDSGEELRSGSCDDPDSGDAAELSSGQ